MFLRLALAFVTLAIASPAANGNDIPVPEPPLFLLIGTGLLAMGVWRRHR
jgi:hypothetical protein